MVWLLLQALLALSLATGARAVGGPLHWHGAGTDHHAHPGAPGELARHHHDADAAVQMLDQGALAAEELGSGSSANAAAAPWPAQAALQVHRQVREHRVGPPPAASWADAERSHPDRPPRR